ncbi:hypothetical protein BDZ94DRAFT_1270532 [Collybia nuda]|uniref:Uncharacterized protein n=1 Tax=Collybia nuda TaxID=64659 RepID=A0A9P6CDS8_9AGAR|nr:hypothetical protein BDZ94DRAFT_1270532 [Collybia nuda]
MSGPRRSTVYDYSSLRIHPDGSRVEQSTRNLRPRTSRTTIKDSRGNWIARDAGGLGIVGRYKRVREETDGEVVSLGANEPSDLGKGKSKGKDKAKPATGYRKRDERAAKRQKFVHDFDFLETPNTLVLPDVQPLPSSDLLKSIHYFASQYYTEKGQLYNASRQYRLEKKQRRLSRLQQEKDAASASPELEPHGASGDTDDAPVKKPRRGGRVKGGKVIYRKDMYKVLEGSALMAIGMLLQEHVNQLMEIRIPDGWEESIMNAEAESDDPDSLSDHDEAPVGTSDGDPEVPSETEEDGGIEGGEDGEASSSGDESSNDSD